MKKIIYLLAFITLNSCNEKIEIEDTFNTYIKNGEFSNYKEADSICGIESRGTDMWCEIANTNKQPDSITVLKSNL